MFFVKVLYLLSLPECDSECKCSNAIAEMGPDIKPEVMRIPIDEAHISCRPPGPVIDFRSSFRKEIWKAFEKIHWDSERDLNSLIKMLNTETMMFMRIIIQHHIDPWKADELLPIHVIRGTDECKVREYSLRCPHLSYQFHERGSDNQK